MKYNVLIVEDQKMPRTLLELYVKKSKNFIIAGSISSAAAAPAFCDGKPVDLILMDVLTDIGANGLDASKVIKERYPKIKIIILTSMPEASWLAKAREIGIESFWYKEADSEGIISIMEKTMNGESVYPDTVPTVHIGKVTNNDFTERELDVLRELLTGDSNSDIAERLGISTETVKFYVTQMLKKTGFHTRTELATIARALGIVIK